MTHLSPSHPYPNRSPAAEGFPSACEARASILRFAAALPIVCAVALGGGCAVIGQTAKTDQTGTPAGNPVVSSGISPMISRPYHNAIGIDGRLSVRYQQNGQEEAVHGSFAWRQVPARTMIELRSPIGQTVAAIDVSPTLATLTQAGQPPRQANDVNSLTADALGWPLPVAGLRDWLQGFGIDANGQRFAVSSAGPREVTTGDGWRITYDAWEQEAGGVSRPRRIDLERDTDQAGPVALRIVIDAWQPG